MAQQQVEILVMTDPRVLSERIEKAINQFDYKLVGPVAVGVNQNGNVVYVATLTREVV